MVHLFVSCLKCFSEWIFFMFIRFIQLRDVFILVFNPTNTIAYMICHSLDDIVRDVLISVELQ